MKIKVNNKEYEVIQKVYDPYYKCVYYYVKEYDEPFIDEDVEVIEL